MTISDRWRRVLAVLRAHMPRQDVEHDQDNQDAGQAVTNKRKSDEKSGTIKKWLRRVRSWKPEIAMVIIQALMLLAQMLTVGALIAYTIYAGKQAQELEISNANAVTNNDKLLKQNAEIACRTLAESRRQSDESLKLARRSLEASQRAKLGVTGFLDMPLKPGVEGEASAIVINAGNSPATNVNAVTNWFILHKPIAEGAQAKRTSENIKMRIVAPVGAPAAYNNPIPPLSEDVIKAIRDGTRLFYTLGWVTYYDGFHQRHLRFCGLHERNGDRWTFCPTNNYAE